MVLIFCAAIVFIPTASLAQQSTGSLSGIVTDSTGAVIPGAKIILLNQSNGITRESQSNSTGAFTFAAIPPASYSITVSMQGFGDIVVKDIALNQGENRRLTELALKPAAGPQVVDVTAQGEVVAMETAESRMTLNTTMITQLGIQGRNASELVKFMPGMALNRGLGQDAFNSINTQTNGGPAGTLSASGTQPYGSMSVTSDGANIIDTGNQGTQIQNLNQDQIAEMTVLNSSYGAEFAKGPVVVQAISKSGGSTFHGSGYLYARNGVMNSQDWFLKNQKQKKPDDSYYYPGATLGGPVLIPGTNFNKERNKMFFFAGYEYMKQQPAGTLHELFIPTAQMLGGDFSAGYLKSLGLTSYPWSVPCDPNNKQWNYGNFCGTAAAAQIQNGIIPKSLIDPNALAMAKYFPSPNQDPATHSGYNYSFMDSTPINRWEFKAKLDYNISSKTKLSGSFTKQNEGDTNNFGVWWWPASTAPYPSQLTAKTISNVWSANLVHTFNEKMTNEFFFAYAYFTFPPMLANPKAVDPATNGFTAKGPFNPDITPQIPNTVSWASNSGATNGYFPAFYAPGFSKGFGNAFGNRKYAPNLGDNFTALVGSHTLKFGFYWDMNRQYYTTGYGDWGQGFYEFDPWGWNSTNNLMADFLMGHAASYSQTSSLPIIDLRYRQTSFYGQDTWKATRRLTLTLGLRMDRMGQWYPANSPGLAVFDPFKYNNSANAAPLSGLVWNKIDSSVPNSGFASMFRPAPRIGVAFDVFGNGKTVLRGGVGTYFWQLSDNDVGPAFMPPMGVISLSSPSSLNSFADAASLKPAPASAFNGNATVLMKGENKTPYTQNWNFIISQQVPWKSMVEIQYAGNRTRDALVAGNGTNVPFYANINKIPLGALFGPDPVTGAACPSAQPNCGGHPDPTQWNGTEQAHFRPYQNYGQAFLVNAHGSYSNYHAFMLSWQKSAGRVNFTSNYTFSKVLGTRDGQTNNGNGDGQILDTFNLDANYGPLAYDHTHIFNVAAVISLPDAVHGNGVAGQVLNGWQVTPTIQAQSGAPIQPNTEGTLNASFSGVSNTAILGTTGENLVPVLTCDPRKGLSGGQYFNPSCFTGPQVGQKGSIIWPYIKGPAYSNFDLSLYKNFRITERQKVQLRWNMFNAFNHPLPQFKLGPVRDAYLDLSATKNANGTYSYTQTNKDLTGIPAFKTGRRVMELAIKYEF